MCGTPAPAIELHQALSAMHDEFSEAGHEANRSSSDGRLRHSGPILGRLIPIIIVSIGLVVFASFFHAVRKGKLPKESGPATEVASTLRMPRLEIAGPRHIVHNSLKGVQHTVAVKLGTTTQATETAKEDDPSQLWNAVGRGSVRAEVALADLYLKGESVPQNCEQAHMLLLAASMKGSKFADDFLKSRYAERCP
jgi:hypothetical protein